MNLHRHARRRSSSPLAAAGRRRSPAAPAVEAVHDRAVHGHDVGERRLVLRRREARPVLVQRDRHLQRLHRARGGRRGDAAHARPPRTPPSPSPTSRTTTASSSRATRAATSSTTSTCASADGKEKDLTPGEKLKATFQGWTPAGRRVLRADQRARPEVLRPLPLRREDLRAHARLPGRDRATSSARSPTTGAGSPSRSRAPRPTATSTCGTSQTKEMKPLHQGAADVLAGGLRPASQGALLPHQRRRRVHPRAPLRPRRRPPRGRREGGLGRHVHVLLARGRYRVTGVNEDGAHRDQARRRAHGRAGGAARSCPPATSPGHASREREAHGLLPQRRPLAEQPLRATSSAGRARAG